MVGVELDHPPHTFRAPEKRPPAIIAIGEVVRLRGRFGDWLLNGQAAAARQALAPAV